MFITDEYFNEIVLQVLNWYKEDESNNIEEATIFKNSSENDLIIYHSSLGRTIRNEFNLWEYSWEPEIIDGVDYSPNHPDSVSMRVITEVWKQIQDK